VWHVGLGEKKNVGCVMEITGYLYNKNSTDNTTFIFVIRVQLQRQFLVTGFLRTKYTEIITIIAHIHKKAGHF
jgi:hypothetical protein